MMLTCRMAADGPARYGGSGTNDELEVINDALRERSTDLNDVNDFLEAVRARRPRTATDARLAAVNRRGRAIVVRLACSALRGPEGQRRGALLTKEAV